MADEAPSAFPKFPSTKAGEHDELLLQKLDGLDAKINYEVKLIWREFESREKARQDKAGEYKEHFTALNNEAARILKATEVTVSRDTWDAFLTTFRLWQAQVNASIDNSITDKEFNEFKNTADKDANTRTGKNQGITMSVTALVAAIGVTATLVGLFFTFVKP